MTKGPVATGSPQPADASNARRRVSSPTELFLAALLVASLVAAAHWPVLGAQALALDDDLFVTNNPLVTQPGWQSTGRFFGEVLNPSSVGGYYLPLAMTSLMVDYALGGRPKDLRVFHRTHLVLHVLNSLLVLLILNLLHYCPVRSRTESTG